MSEHTKGRLAYQEYSDTYTHILRDEGGGFILQLSQDTTGKSEANARRLAACWNAFENVRTELVEAMIGTGAMQLASDSMSALPAVQSELTAARALLRRAYGGMTYAIGVADQLNNELNGASVAGQNMFSARENAYRIRSYLDACDTLGGNIEVTS